MSTTRYSRTMRRVAIKSAKSIVDRFDSAVRWHLIKTLCVEIVQIFMEINFRCKACLSYATRPGAHSDIANDTAIENNRTKNQEKYEGSLNSVIASSNRGTMREKYAKDVFVHQTHRKT